MPFARLSTSTAGWLLALLLVVTFALGALLTLTVHERNRIEQQLKDTKEDLNEQKHETKVEKSNVAGCMSQIAQLNQGIAEQSMAQIASAAQADSRAGATLALLPTLIRADATQVVSPAVATDWVKDLFK